MRSDTPATLDRHACPPPRLRQGFTIVELLVTLAIMAVLAAMTVFAMGPLQDRSAVSGGASLLQTWLNTARQRAIRDKVPSGLRFLAGNSLPSQGASYPYYVTRLVYLEGGNDIFGTLYGGPGTNGVTTFTLSAALPANVNPPLGAAGTADSIIINSGMPQLTSTSGGAPGATALSVPSNFPYAIQSASPLPFRIVRGPIAIAGGVGGTDSDNVLLMPRGSCVNFDPQTTQTTLYPGGIDLSNYNSTGNGALNFIPKAYFTGIGSLVGPTGNTSPTATNTSNGMDIMFAPDGTVMSPTSTYPIVFWVCSTTSAIPANSTTPIIEAMRGNPSLVVVYPRTGQVISYVVEFDQFPVPSGSSIIKANALKDVL